MWAYESHVQLPPVLQVLVRSYNSRSDSVNKEITVRENYVSHPSID